MTASGRTDRFLRLQLAAALLLAGCNASTKSDRQAKVLDNSTSSPGVIEFAEVQSEIGIDFTHFDSRRDSLLPEDIGSGVGWADYDNDGDQDLYVVNFAGPFLMAEAELKKRAGNKLFRNDGGKFTDVTEESGLGHVGWNYACLWVDVDNDNWLDLIVTHYDGVMLFRNRSDGTFEERTMECGFADIHRFLLGLTAGDYDLDGDLDLFICGYVKFDRERARNRPQVAGRPAVWTNPVSYDAVPSILLRNNGEGVFEDVTVAAGVADPNGKSMQAVFCDFNNDNWPDLYVANDVGTADALFMNRGDGSFQDVSTLAGTYDRRATMGVAVGDVWHRGWMDIFTTHWVNEDHALWKNQSGLAEGKSILMEDVGPQTGLLEIKSTADVGWGTELIDFDNDGHLDLILANGSTIEDELTLEVLKDPKLLPQKCRLLHNDGNANFVDVSSEGGDFFSKDLVARGLACADYDQDGRVDVAIVIHSGKAVLLHNETAKTGHWLRVELKGTSNRFGVGAKIQVVAGGTTFTRQTVSSSSYLSSSSLTTHFGLGEVDVVDSILVTWPSGKTTIKNSIKADQSVTMEEN